MLVSGVEKNRATFVSAMNTQAKQWGTRFTTFADVTGEEDNSVSTAKEYLDIFTAAINNATVSQVLSAKGYEYNEFEDIDGKPYHYDDHSNDLQSKADLSFEILETSSLTWDPFTGELDFACATVANDAIPTTKHINVLIFRRRIFYSL